MNADPLEAMWSLVELIVGIVLLWRIAVPFFLSVMLAVLLSRTFPFFDATVGIATAITGLTFGTYWHARHEDGLGLSEKRQTKDQPVSWPVAALGLMFIGFIWGGLFTAFTGSHWRSAVGLLLTTIPVLVWNKKVLHAELQLKTLVFAYGFLLVGLILGVLFHGASNGF